jgi:flagellar assembly protein FliH
MAASRTANKRFLFERSFDDPRRLYLPGERRKSELEAERKAMELAASKAAEDAVKTQAHPVAAEPTAPAEPEAKFTQSQLDAAREEGYVAGHTAALEEAETAREHYVADAISLIAQGLGKLDEQQQAANRDIGELAIRVLFAVARKTIPETAHQFAHENISDFVKKVLPVVLGEPKLLIRVHAMIVEDMQQRLADVFTRAGFQGGYTVVADYELQPGDCKVEWSGGGAERSETRIWQEIERTMAENFGATEDATPATPSAEQTTDTEQSAAMPA